MKKTIILSLLMSLASTQISFAKEGAFGFHWGMTLSQAKKLGAKCKFTETVGRMYFCAIEKAPQNLSIASLYTLVFDQQFNLQKIVVKSNMITGDSDGSEGIGEYKKYKDILIKKYGQPSLNYEVTGITVYKEDDEFYECLRYDGCGGYKSLFDVKGGGVVVLAIIGKSRGEGYLEFTYEGPKWEKVVDLMKSKKLKDDTSAL